MWLIYHFIILIVMGYQSHINGILMAESHRLNIAHPLNGPKSV